MLGILVLLWAKLMGEVGSIIQGVWAAIKKMNLASRQGAHAIFAPIGPYRAKRGHSKGLKEVRESAQP